MKQGYVPKGTVVTCFKKATYKYGPILLRGIIPFDAIEPKYYKNRSVSTVFVLKIDIAYYTPNVYLNSSCDVCFAKLKGK
jgi:hypothetical protein